MIFDATCSDGSCDDDRAFARELLVHRPTIRRPITVWNFMNFSAIHILREINFGLYTTQNLAIWAIFYMA